MPPYCHSHLLSCCSHLVFWQTWWGLFPSLFSHVVFLITQPFFTVREAGDKIGYGGPPGASKWLVSWLDWWFSVEVIAIISELRYLHLGSAVKSSKWSLLIISTVADSCRSKWLFTVTLYCRYCMLLSLAEASTALEINTCTHCKPHN